jgi:hypothetical protein
MAVPGTDHGKKQRLPPGGSKQQRGHGSAGAIRHKKGLPPHVPQQEILRSELPFHGHGPGVGVGGGAGAVGGDGDSRDLFEALERHTSHHKLKEDYQCQVIPSTLTSFLPLRYIIPSTSTSIYHCHNFNISSLHLQCHSFHPKVEYQRLLKHAKDGILFTKDIMTSDDGHTTRMGLQADESTIEDLLFSDVRFLDDVSKMVRSRLAQAGEALANANGPGHDGNNLHTGTALLASENALMVDKLRVMDHELKFADELIAAHTGPNIVQQYRQRVEEHLSDIDHFKREIMSLEVESKRKGFLELAEESVQRDKDLAAIKTQLVLQKFKVGITHDRAQQELRGIMQVKDAREDAHLNFCDTHEYDDHHDDWEYTMEHKESIALRHVCKKVEIEYHSFHFTISFLQLYYHSFHYFIIPSTSMCHSFHVIVPFLTFNIVTSSAAAIWRTCSTASTTWTSTGRKTTAAFFPPSTA